MLHAAKFIQDSALRDRIRDRIARPRPLPRRLVRQATSARVSYLAVTGPATEAQAEPFAGSLLVGGCKVVVASGAAERAAALAEAGRFGSVRFVVAGPATASDPNVTVLTFTTSGWRSGVASAVEAGVHGEGG